MFIMIKEKNKINESGLKVCAPPKNQVLPKTIAGNSSNDVKVTGNGHIERFGFVILA